MRSRWLVIWAAVPAVALLVAVAASTAGLAAVPVLASSLAACVVAALVVLSLVLDRRTRSAVRQLSADTKRLIASDAELRRAQLRSEIDRGSARTAEAVRIANDHGVAQLEAMMQLLRLLEPTAFLPRTRGWAASPDVLLLLSEAIRDERPRLVLDLGSGLSTVVAALTVRAHGLDCRVVALDHEASFAQQTRTLLVRHGLDHLAEVRTAELAPTAVGDEVLPWYDLSSISDLEGIGVVFVDGPPGVGGPQARYPALPLLRSRLAPGAVFLLDDADRPDERAIIERWETQSGSVATWLRLEKGAATVRVTAP